MNDEVLEKVGFRSNQNSFNSEYDLFLKPLWRPSSLSELNLF